MANKKTENVCTIPGCKGYGTECSKWFGGKCFGHGGKPVAHDPTEKISGAQQQDEAVAVEPVDA